MTDPDAAPRDIETANERAYWAQGFDRGYAVGYRTSTRDHQTRRISRMEFIAMFLLVCLIASAAFLAGAAWNADAYERGRQDAVTFMQDIADAASAYESGRLEGIDAARHIRNESTDG